MPWLAGLRLNDVALDDVADQDVVLVVEHDAALETDSDFTSVVLHSPERSDLAVVDRGASAKESRLRAAAYEAVDHARARDRGLAGGEDLQHLGMAEKRLDHLRLERALHVGFQDDLELLGLALLDLREHLVERRRSFRRGAGSALARVLRDHSSGGFLIRDDAHDIAGLRDLG